MIKNLLSFFAALALSTLVYSQTTVLETKVSINDRKATIKKLLTDISKKYDISFYYNSAIQDLQKTIDIDMQSVPLRNVLETLFENTNLIYRLEGNKILLNTTPRKNQKAIIHGYITDGGNKETLVGANVFIRNANTGTTSNSFGFYSLTLSELPAAVTFSFIGYNDSTIEVTTAADIVLNVALSPNSMTMQEVTVTSDVSNATTSQIGYSRLSMREVKLLPAFLGENDILRTLQLMPGIKSGNETSSGFYVRGGGPDQNLMLLDGATMYNTSHSFNLFSVFNPGSIKNVEIYKSAFPARYGGRLSSVIDVRLKDGNMTKYDCEIALGYLTSKITFEGPIVKDKTSFIISARRSFLDLFTRWKIKTDPDTVIQTATVFNDASLKINHKFSDKDRIFASFYESGDGFLVKEEDKNRALNYTNSTKAKVAWNNYNGSLRWNHLFSSKLFSNTTLTYTKFILGVRFASNLDYADPNKIDYLFSKSFSSTIEDFGLRTDFDLFPNSHHAIKYGVSAQTHRYQPGVSSMKQSDETSSINTSTKGTYHSAEFSGYIEDEIEVTTNINVNIGMNMSALATSNKTYSSMQPRLAVRYSLSSSRSLKASYSKMTQYIHLLSSGGSTLPLDLWVPVTNVVRPMNAVQYSFGYAQDFMDKKYEFTAETYLKQMDNLIAYKDGADFTNTTIPWYEKIITGGKGKSYGLELFVKKNSGSLTGWIGYTLSKVDRTFKDLDNGKSFPYKFDRRHDVSIVSMYKVSDRINLSGSWVFSTGNAITFPAGTYPTAQNFFYQANSSSTSGIQYYNGRNAVRMPNYHRLDLGINFIKVRKRGTRTWNFSVYNAYARQNPFYIYATADQNGNRKMKQVSAYSILPSFTYSFKFN